MSYRTKQDAEAAGYVSARGRKLEEYRGFRIVSRDVSGPNQMGYVFSVAIGSDHSAICDALFERRFRSGEKHTGVMPDTQSETLWLTESKNRLNQLGAFWVCYHREDLDKYLQASREYIDRLIADDPAIGAAVSEFEAEQDRKRLKDAEYAARRARKLVAKYGYENLTQQWRAVYDGAV